MKKILLILLIFLIHLQADSLAQDSLRNNAFESWYKEQVIVLNLQGYSDRIRDFLSTTAKNTGVFSETTNNIFECKLDDLLLLDEIKFVETDSLPVFDINLKLNRVYDRIPNSEYAESINTLILNTTIYQEPALIRILSSASFLLDYPIKGVDLRIDIFAVGSFLYNWKNLVSDVQIEDTYGYLAFNKSIFKELSFDDNVVIRNQFDSYLQTITNHDSILDVSINFARIYLDKKLNNEAVVARKGENQITVTNAKNIMSRNDGYWEKFEITFGDIFLSNSKLRCFVAINGRYHDNRTPRPPTTKFWLDGGFDLSKPYNSNLYNFGNDLLSAIVQNLNK